LNGIEDGAPSKGKRDKDAKKGEQRHTARPRAKETANVASEGWFDHHRLLPAAFSF
jgi:hypothetical protein